MNFSVVGLGEVLWDMLATGPQLGGAPANFAYHAHTLGAQSQVITRVGDDEHGREIIRRFRDMALPADTVQIDPTAPTGTAKVSLAADGVAHFTIQENVAWDYLEVTPEALTAVRHAHAICFGSLGQRCEVSCNTIQQLVSAAPEGAMRIFDINLRQHYYSRNLIERSLRLANVLKLNDDELRTLAQWFSLAGSTERQIESLARAFQQRVVALTRGPRGSLLYQDGRWSNCPSRAVEVADTVGAGDSFAAALVVGLLHKMDLDEINSLANEIARYVCSRPGATPTLPAEFAQKFRAAFRHDSQQ
jgi:fructokinase